MPSPHALAAKNIRADLARLFPGVRFSVASQKDTVFIAWRGGPTVTEVDETVNRYRRGQAVPGGPQADGHAGRILLERRMAVGEGRHMAAWSPEEDAQLAARFAHGLSPKELAELHQRTVNALIGRLVRLGKVTNKDGLIFKDDTLWFDNRRPRS